ncbi:ribosome recycling factor [Bauldia sp.]|uniref:ribosome recycling factor n=1 Tax=Bauldia sp. TaxID=2575872 RepID=UPI003BA86B82
MDFNDLERRMNGAVSVLKSELAGLRTGRASISLLEPITVEVYGAAMPLNQVATISVPESRMLSVQVWDRSNVQAVDRAIRESSLGLNPIVEGELLRIPIPELNAERRQELVKVAHKYAEQAKIAVRHVRRDGMDTLKKEEKDGMGEDESHGVADRIQALTDGHVREIDEMLSQKEAEITQV